MRKKVSVSVKASIALVLVLISVAGWYAWFRPDIPASSEAAITRFSTDSLPPDLVRNISTIRFSDTADVSGLRYQWQIAGKRPLNILQMVGNGCGFLDFDGDGNLDVLLVGPTVSLYKGDGKGHFADVSHDTGMDRLHGHYLGCAAGDYDNDGFPDLYLSGWRAGALLHNERGGRFTDASAAAGIPQQPWGTSCAWADVDDDGLLDLFVCNYLDFGPQTKPQLCTAKGRGNRDYELACEPTVYRALKPKIYHNVAGKRFEDRTAAWGLDKSAGAGLGAAFADFDDSGRPGLAVANDERLGDLFQSLQSGRMQNIGVESGTASDAGHVHGGMGIDWGDTDNDGKLDLFVATFEGQVKNLYHNQGGGLFQDTSAALGIHHFTRGYVAFGCKFLDVDNDGFLDLVISNGHTYDNVADILPGRTFRQPTQLLYNAAGRKFVDVSESAGIATLPSIVGRGLATGDYDNDGRIDAIVVDSEGKPQLLHNETTGSGHWLSIKLLGKECNRDAYGAIVTVTAGALTRTRLCHADGSYFSSSDPRVHVGLGKETVCSIKVRWPDGKVTLMDDIAADRQLSITEEPGKAGTQSSQPISKAVR
jgi:hypothetical protein